MSPGRSSLYSLLIVLACAGSFANTFANEFVSGDIEYIVENPALRSPGVAATAFFRDYWYSQRQEARGFYYRPLVVLLDALDLAVYGERPAGFHLTNLLLHMGVALLLYLLGRRLALSPGAALAGALLFAVHPIHVHAVTYISGRTSVLSALFYLAGLAAALRAPLRGAVVAGLFLGGLLSKEVAVTFPLVALAAVRFGEPAVAPVRQSLRRAAPLLAWLGGAALIYATLRTLALGWTLSGGASGLWDTLGPVAVVLTAARTYGFYMARLVAPVDLSYLPPFVPALSAADLAGWACLVLVLALAALAWLGPRSGVALRVGLTLLLVGLLPTSNLVPMEYFVKDHHAYLPSAGFCLLLAAGLDRAGAALAARAEPGRLRWYGAAVVGALALAGMFASLTYNLSWKNSEALSRRVLAFEHEVPSGLWAHPAMRDSAFGFAVAHYNLAQDLVRRGRCSRALAHLRRARELSPAPGMRHRAAETEGDCRRAAGDLEGALVLYQLAAGDASLGPGPPFKAGQLLLQGGSADAARRFFALACQRGFGPACKLQPGRQP